jgi:hypothetical protein
MLRVIPPAVTDHRSVGRVGRMLNAPDPRSACLVMQGVIPHPGYAGRWLGRECSMELAGRRNHGSTNAGRAGGFMTQVIPGTGQPALRRQHRAPGADGSAGTLPRTGRPRAAR